MYGNPRDGIILYRTNEDGEYAISEDYGNNYTDIEESEIPEVTLTRLLFAKEKRWSTITYNKKEIIALPINNDDSGITKEEFINHVLRIYGPFIEYDEVINKIYVIQYDETNTKQKYPFKRSVLQKLAKNYKYYGNLLEEFEW